VTASYTDLFYLYTHKLEPFLLHAEVVCYFGKKTKKLKYIQFAIENKFQTRWPVSQQAIIKMKTILQNPSLHK